MDKDRDIEKGRNRDKAKRKTRRGKRGQKPNENKEGRVQPGVGLENTRLK